MPAVKHKLEGFLLLLVIVALPIGVLVGIHAWQQWTLFDRGSPTPQVVRLAELEKNGPGDNIHVTVTDLTFGDDYVIQQENFKWNCVWIPVYPKGSRTDPSDVKVIVRTFQPKSPTDLDAFCRQPQVTGLVTNSIHRLGTSQANLLTHSYPKANFDNILMVEDSKPFPSQTEVLVAIAGAIGLIVLAVVCGLILLCRLLFMLRPAPVDAQELNRFHSHG